MDEQPDIEISPIPLLEIVAKEVDVLSDIFWQFIEIIPGEEDVISVAFEVVDPANVVEFNV